MAQDYILQRNVQVTLIPAGDAVVLSSGTSVTVTQALGGSVTIRTDMGLFRVAPEDIEALGPGAVEAYTIKAEAPEGLDGPFGEDHVWAALKGCFDPEIPLNIVDLGLVYDLALSGNDDARSVAVKMTLTAPGCGMGPTIAADAQARIEALPEVQTATVDIVWDPQWTPHMISPEGRKVLGLD